MRTTLDIDSDVIDAAKALAEAGNISIGKALSRLARRGIAAPTPFAERNGFAVFAVGMEVPRFGPADVAAALDAEDHRTGRAFLAPEH